MDPLDPNPDPQTDIPADLGLTPEGLDVLRGSGTGLG